MALLFLKRNLFPSKDKQGKRSNGYGEDTRPAVSPEQAVLTFHPVKPLLSPVSDGDTIRGDFYHDDIESPRPRYDTFGGSTPPDEDDADSTSSQRSRINPRIVSDSILGLSDGLTVPFALSAGLSALGNTKVVVLGGLAELTAGAISMGLGGYVGAKSEA